MKSLVFCTIMASICSADLAYQSDWSGGPGTLGPVTNWGNDFSCETAMSWVEAPGLLSLAAGVQCTVDESCRGLASADIDGDGDLDLFASCYAANKVVWWENTHPSGRRWVEHVIQSSFTNPQAITCADFDGDGDIDVACASTISANVTWWSNNNGGQNWIAHIVDSLSGVGALHFGDLDGDGDIDLIGTVNTSSDVLWWRNSGGGISWTRITVDGSFEGANDVLCADVDGDGIKDIAACGSGLWVKSVAWWDNSGTGITWTEHTIDLRFDGAKSLVVNDIDSDGDMDVAAAASTANDVVWWANTGGTGLSWTEHVVDDNFTGAYSMLVTDIDMDGDLDMMVAGSTSGDVAWWSNLDGMGTSWDKNTLTLGLSDAWEVHGAEVDGDGYPELFAAGSPATWMWDLNEYQSDGGMESSILDTQCDPDWGSALWSASAPSGTGVYFRFRASDNPAAMGDWSETASSPCPLNIFIDDGDRYFQYRVHMMSGNPDATPVLNDVTVTWTPLGVEGGSGPAEFELIPVTPNPCHSAPEIGFGLPWAESVVLQLFDISGRLVRTVRATGFEPGWHSIRLEEMDPGVYFVRMRAGDFEAAERFVVLE